MATPNQIWLPAKLDFKEGQGFKGICPFNRMSLGVRLTAEPGPQMIKEGPHSSVEAGFCLQWGTLMQHDNTVLESASHHHTLPDLHLSLLSSV